MEIIAAFFVILPFILIITFLGTVWRGWIITKLWAWFLVPLFHVQQLSIAQAIGISLVVGALVGQQQVTQTQEGGKAQVVANTVGPGLITLIMAWIVHSFFM